VLLKLGNGNEGLSTAREGANVLSLSIVLEEMVSQAGFGGELLVATRSGANKRLIVGVGSDVVLEGVFSLERLAAAFKVTDVGSGVRVGSDVSENFGMVSKNFSAVWVFAHVVLLLSFLLDFEELIALGGKVHSIKLVKVSHC